MNVNSLYLDACLLSQQKKTRHHSLLTNALGSAVIKNSVKMIMHLAEFYSRCMPKTDLI